jgi:hypothetical protein
LIRPTGPITIGDTPRDIAAGLLLSRKHGRMNDPYRAVAPDDRLAFFTLKRVARLPLFKWGGSHVQSHSDE